MQKLSDPGTLPALSRRRPGCSVGIGGKHGPCDRGCGGTARFQDDPHWRDLILFYEYFHGDNGAGLGAGHQTGWTSLVAPLPDLFGRIDAKTLLELERGSVLARVVRGQVGGEPAGTG